MIFGTYSVPRVQEESVCRSAKNYRFTEVGVYKIHSNVLLPNVNFEEEKSDPDEIDASIFLNDGETQLDLSPLIYTQNFLTARYIGRAPLEWYQEENETKLGRQFTLLCIGGNPNAEYRVFGTEDAIRGYNRNANENIKLPGGGEQLDG